jgi:hypothetical protein
MNWLGFFPGILNVTPASRAGQGEANHEDAHAPHTDRGCLPAAAVLASNARTRDSGAVWFES